MTNAQTVASAGLAIEVPSAIAKCATNTAPTNVLEMSAAANFSKLLEGDLYEGELNGECFSGGLLNRSRPISLTQKPWFCFPDTYQSFLICSLLM